MQTKIPLKNIYLILVITIGLIGLGVGSTFAMFTATSTIENPISFASNLTYTGKVSETIEVTVPAYSDKLVDIVISNPNTSPINYKAWYATLSDYISIGTSSSNTSYGPTGVLPANTNFTLTMTIRNSSNIPIEVTIGISSSLSNIVLASGMNTLSLQSLPTIINQIGSEYLTNLYLKNKDKQPVTNNSIQYQTSSSVHLMNDRLGKPSNDLDSGNIRYYGASNDVNNYVYFNCDDYLNQNGNTCELWRIIGVFDGKMKIIRNDSIATASWDTSDSTINSGEGINEWGQADLMKLLNPGFETNTIEDGNTLVNNSLYWNRTSGASNYYIDANDTYTSVDENNTTFFINGLKSSSRSNIASMNWYLGDVENPDYPDKIYTAERENRRIVEPTDEVARENTWMGKIALPYLSDYGYATDFSKCELPIAGYHNDNTNSNTCRSNNWLYSSELNQWLLTPYYHASSALQSSNRIWTIKDDGDAEAIISSNGTIAVRPTLYLNSNQYIWDGEGTLTNPYQLINK